MMVAEKMQTNRHREEYSRRCFDEGRSLLFVIGVGICYKVS